MAKVINNLGNSDLTAGKELDKPGMLPREQPAYFTQTEHLSDGKDKVVAVRG